MIAALKITQREGSLLSYVGGSFFLISFGMAFGRIGRDALFIQEVGAGGLAIIYICNAVVIVLVSAVYARFYDRISRSSLLVVLLLGSAGLVSALL